MRATGRQAGVWLSILVSLWAVGCGGSGSGNGQGQQQKSTPAVAVTPTSGAVTTVQSLQVTVTVSGAGSAPTGSVTLSSGTYSSPATTLTGGSASITIPAGLLAAGTDTLTANYTPDAASSSTYNGSSGAGQVTVSKTTPTVTVLTALSSITTTQSDTVTVTVSGGTGAPTATGTVILASVGYTSAAATLANGSAQIVIPAGVLGVGNDGLTATYAPDTPGSAIYNGAGGLSTVTVNLIVPAVTVNPGSSSIAANQPLAVTVGVSGGSGNPTATGSVTLSGGGYTTPSATSLTNGSAQINIPASSLTTGSDSLMATYTPDSTSSSIYAGATGVGQVMVNSPVAYLLTVDSAAPSSGISISPVSPADNNGASSGTTPFTRSYYSGTQVALSAPLSDNGYSFVSWSGCALTSGSGGINCVVTVSANTTVTANYNQAGITSITVTPSTATIGTQQQFTATVSGTGSYSSGVTWSLTCSSCGSLSPGTLSSSGLYTTPYPAPASVTITATSTMSGFTNVSGSATVVLSSPATASGPALAVNVGAPGNPISPDIYGMDAYLLHGSAADTAAVAPTNITIDRWGGDSTERYNYQLDVTNSIDDWFFENGGGNGGDGWPAVSGVKAFDALVESNNADGIRTSGHGPCAWLGGKGQHVVQLSGGDLS